MERLGCALGVCALILINIFIGTWSVITILSWFGVTTSIFLCGLIGLVFGEFTIPLALLGCIFKLFGLF